MVLKMNVFGATDFYLDNNDLTCEKPEPICLVLVGFMVGWLVNEIWMDLK